VTSRRISWSVRGCVFTLVLVVALGAHSGWGDGFYPVIGTYDDRGRLAGVHIDLQVVGDFSL
jgi:hypothetical protein